MPPKPWFWGREAFSCQTCKKFKLSYYRNYCIDCNRILHSDKDHQVPFVDGPNMPQTSKMADGRHLEKLKNHCLCTSTPYECFIAIITSPPGRVRSIVMSMSVCQSVCPLAYSEDTRPNFTNFLRVARGRCSVNFWLHYSMLLTVFTEWTNTKSFYRLASTLFPKQVGSQDFHSGVALPFFSWSFSPFLCPFFPSYPPLPLEVGPLNQLGGLGSAVSSLGVRADPGRQPISKYFLS